MCPHSRVRSTSWTKPRAHTQPITCNTIPQKNTMIPYMAQSHSPLNSQVLAIFFLFEPIPATPQYPVFTDRYSPQYGLLTLLLHFMTNAFFSWHSYPFPLLPPPPPHFSIIQPVQSRARYHPWLLWQYFSDPTPIFPQPFTWFRLYQAQRIMFLGRFLV